MSSPSSSLPEASSIPYVLGTKNPCKKGDCASVHASPCASPCSCVSVNVSPCTHMSVHASACTHVCLCTQFSRYYTCLCASPCLRCLCTTFHVHTYMSVCMLIHVHMCIFMLLLVYVRICVCGHTFPCVCAHTDLRTLSAPLHASVYACQVLVKSMTYCWLVLSHCWAPGPSEPP